MSGWCQTDIYLFSGFPWILSLVLKHQGTLSLKFDNSEKFTMVFINNVFSVLAFMWLLARSAVATGGLNGLPVLNGPITPPYFNTIPGMKTRVGEFIHPGIWHTHADLERIRLGVQNGTEPWRSAFVNFTTDRFSSSEVRKTAHHLSYNPKYLHRIPADLEMSPFELQYADNISPHPV